MANEIHTYNPKKVTIALGNHLVTGYAEDSFVGIQQPQDGVTFKVGCDGEVVRAISPNESFTVQITVLQTSKTNRWLINKYYQDIEDGNGLFPITIKDILGATVFASNQAWVTKLADHGYGLQSNNRQWTIVCGSGKLEQS